MDEIKRCSKCKMIYLKSNFYKDITKNDGYRPSCKICCQKYYYNNQNRILNNQKIYNENNRDKINAYERQKRKTDCIFNLSCKIRQKTNYAFKSHINKMNILIGCSNYQLRKWIIYQLYGDMTLENYGIIWCLDHCYPLSKINEFEMNKYTNWVNIRPMYITDNISKRNKIDNRLYLLQQIKAKYFLKINNDQEGLNEDIH